MSESVNQSVSQSQVSVVNGNIKTDLHTKPTATHQYLHATSCHPHHNKSSIPYSQALRLRCICSDDSDLQIRIEKLQFYLEQRGYKKEALIPQLERARAKPREDCLLPTAKKQQDPQIPLVVTYAPTLPSLGKITRQHHHILHLSERTKQAFPQPPTVAYRRPKNLRDLLVRADLAPRANHPPGNTPCGRSRCKTCPALMTTDIFTSHCTGKTYTLRTAATCKSKDVVYLIQCKRCGLQYVGETEQALNERLNSHRSDIKRKNIDKPVAAHFNKPGHSSTDLAVMVIDQLWGNDSVIRKIREERWITILQTASPGGLNLRAECN